MIVFNIFAIIPAIATFLGMILGHLIFGDNKLGITFALAVGTAADFAFRFFSHRNLGTERFFFPSTGGHLCFIPVWIVGIILTIYSLTQASGEM